MDEYLNSFHELIELAVHSERLAIVVKFCWGLQQDIQDQIMHMGMGHPGDDDPESWYEAVVHCDENCTTNAIFNCTLPTASVCTLLTVVFPCSSTISNWAPNWPPATTFPKVNPTANRKPPKVKMEDACKPVQLSCYRCGSLDHLKPDCPLHFDIRFMTVEGK